MRNSVLVVRNAGTSKELRMWVKLTPEQYERLKRIVLEKKVSATEAYDILMSENKM